jgi:hypothetical protein
VHELEISFHFLDLLNLLFKAFLSIFLWNSVTSGLDNEPARLGSVQLARITSWLGSARYPNEHKRLIGSAWSGSRVCEFAEEAREPNTDIPSQVICIYTDQIKKY